MTTRYRRLLCTHDAGRSQMAMGYISYLAGDRAVAWSGGSEPAGGRYEEWVLDDPAALDVTAVRPVRDEIERRVRVLLDELGVAAR